MAEPLPAHRYGAPVRVRGPPLPALGQARSSTTCSVTRARTRGRVITWRLPRTLLPIRGRQSGQLAVACSTRWVLLPSPAKAVGPLPPFSLGTAASAPSSFCWPSNSAIRFHHRFRHLGTNGCSHSHHAVSVNPQGRSDPRGTHGALNHLAVPGTLPPIRRAPPAARGRLAVACWN